MFAKILKELRGDNNITQAELGKAIGVSQGTIYFWENGINEPSAGYIVKLADFFDITTDELLGREKIQKSSTPSLKILGSYSKLNQKNKNLAIKIIDAIVENQ